MYSFDGCTKYGACSVVPFPCGHYLGSPFCSPDHDLYFFDTMPDSRIFVGLNPYYCRILNRHNLIGHDHATKWKHWILTPMFFSSWELGLITLPLKLLVRCSGIGALNLIAIDFHLIFMCSAINYQCRRTLICGCFSSSSLFAHLNRIILHFCNGSIILTDSAPLSFVSMQKPELC